MVTINKCKNLKKSFFVYLVESIKVMYKEIVISIFFIISSSSQPIFSVKNGAVWVLLWYIISLFLLLSGCYYNYRYNEEGMRKKRWYRRHGFDDMMTEKQKNEIRWFKKVNIELGGWTFLLIKVSIAFLLEAIMLGVSLMHQFSDYENYMENDQMFFIGVFIDTLVITVASGYYSIIIDVASDVIGFKNKVRAILNAFEGNVIKKIFCHLISLALLVYAVVYSFNEFSWYAPFVLGVLYIIFLAMPVKDTAAIF